MIFTHEDAVAHLVDFAGGGAADNLHRDCRRAIQSAYREMPVVHRWPYYYRSGAITLEPAKDSYLLPEDFVAAGSAFRFSNPGGCDLVYVPPDAWMDMQRGDSSGVIRGGYSIFGDVANPSRLVLRINSQVGDNLDLRYAYARRPRPLLVERESGLASTVGVILTTAGVSYATKAGACVRLSSTPKFPTSPIGTPSGSNPAIWETTASAVSGTTIMLSAAPTSNLTNVGFTVSDPVDVDPGSMLEVFLRSAEKFLSIARKLKDMPNAQAAWQEALERGKGAASPSFGPRVAGPQWCGPRGPASYRGQPFNWEFQ